MSRYVLFVDDDPDIRDLTQLVLEGYGYEVVTAGEGAEALEVLAARGPPQVILLDLRMPGMSGEELLPRLRALYGRSVPVIVLSGDATARQAARAQGADGFLAKPVGVQDLLTTIGQYGEEQAQHAH